MIVRDTPDVDAARAEVKRTEATEEAARQAVDAAREAIGAGGSKGALHGYKLALTRAIERAEQARASLRRVSRDAEARRAEATVRDTRGLQSEAVALAREARRIEAGAWRSADLALGSLERADAAALDWRQRAAAFNTRSATRLAGQPYPQAGSITALSDLRRSWAEVAGGTARLLRDYPRGEE